MLSEKLLNLIKECEKALNLIMYKSGEMEKDPISENLVKCTNLIKTVSQNGKRVHKFERSFNSVLIENYDNLIQGFKIKSGDKKIHNDKWIFKGDKNISVVINNKYDMYIPFSIIYKKFVDNHSDMRNKVKDEVEEDEVDVKIFELDKKYLTQRAALYYRFADFVLSIADIVTENGEKDNEYDTMALSMVVADTQTEAKVSDDLMNGLSSDNRILDYISKITGKDITSMEDLPNFLMEALSNGEGVNAVEGVMKMMTGGGDVPPENQS